jgi:hypothetical protein
MCWHGSVGRRAKFTEAREVCEDASQPRYGYVVGVLVN